MQDPVQNPTIQQNQDVNDDQTSSQSRQPVSFSLNKESGPITISDNEPNLHPEVKAVGVELVPQKPNLDEVHRQLGVVHSGPTTPVLTEPARDIKLPMSQAEAVAAEKGKDDNSGTWLGTLLAKIYRRLAVLGLKEGTV